MKKIAKSQSTKSSRAGLVMRDSDYVGMTDAIYRSQSVIEFHMDGTIISANSNFLSLTGYELHEIVGRHHRIFVESEIASSQQYTAMWEALGRGEFFSSEFKRLNKNGQEIWLQASYNPIFEDDGTPYKVVKFATDITERKMLDTMIASQAVIEFGLDGIILSANEKFLTLMGYELDEIVGQHHSIFVKPEFLNNHAQEYAAFWATLREGEIQTAEFKRVGNKGKEVWLQASYTPFVDRKGEPYKIVKFATDVTEQKRSEAKIHAQQKAMMQMSTPVTAIWNDILLLPIVGFIDSQRAQDVMSAILSNIDETRARVFIMDISGVAVVDTAVANHLIKITKATRLMGCECMISGLSPAIAQTIVDLGIETGDIRTTATLRDALHAAFASIGVTVNAFPGA